MTKLRSVMQGDNGDQVVVGLRQRVNGEWVPIDLSTATKVDTFVRRGRHAATLATAITTAVDGTITIDTGTGATGWLPQKPVEGTWNVQYQITFNDGRIITVPNEGYDTIEVERQLD